jgi:hypothetical protein
MLQMMLKRFINVSTRVYKYQHQLQHIEKSKLDIVREFNCVVEFHFRTKQQKFKNVIIHGKIANSSGVPA